MSAPKDPEKASTASIKISPEVRDQLKAMGGTLDEAIRELLDRPPANPTAAAVPDCWYEALAAGADADALLAAGMDWAAKQFLGRANYQKSSGIDLTAMADDEIEAISLGDAKRIGGVTDERIKRTIARLEKWNEAQAEVSRKIKITGSYVFSLRQEIARLTGGKIPCPNRNAVFAYFVDRPDDDLPKNHNRTIDAVALGVQAFADLISDKIEDEYQLVYDRLMAYGK